MGNFINLKGQKFGKLTVLKRVENDKQRRIQWLCECECGTQTIVRGSNLKNGNTTTCGCGFRNSKGRYKHGLSRSRLYKVYQSMKSRCYYTKSREYNSYGGRGIKICDEWLFDFMSFYNWAMANGYDENAKFGECTIDRINSNGNYEPSNCRWISLQEQQKTRNCKKK